MLDRPLASVRRPLASLSSRRKLDPEISDAVKARLVRVLIADDEPIARRVLREEIELQPGVEIVGEADGLACPKKSLPGPGSGVPGSADA
jgi:hypothetical protein